MKSVMTRRPSRSGEIRAVLAEEIESGALLPGAALDERSLSERFGVSRTPIREALQQLATQDLVRIEPRHGVFVTKMSIPELRSMLELLGELEALCAKFAARRSSEAHRAQLMAALKRCDVKGARKVAQEYSDANVAFHEAIYEAGCNPYLADQVRKIRRLIYRYRPNAFEALRERQKSLAAHREIADAIMAGDEDKAHAAMLEHVPVGTTGFSEFLSTLPLSLIDHNAVQATDEAAE